jgi:hypothetical protein
VARRCTRLSPDNALFRLRDQRKPFFFEFLCQFSFGCEKSVWFLIALDIPRNGGAQCIQQSDGRDCVVEN